MKMVIAIIQAHKLDYVKKELYKEEVNLITVKRSIRARQAVGRLGSLPRCKRERKPFKKGKARNSALTTLP